MIEEYYIYRHIRLDTMSVFYIGMGQTNHDGKFLHTRYKRAYVNRNRNKYWNNIVNSTEYDIEIIFRSHDLSEIIKKEIEFISIYKRKCDGGSLCNFSTGGESGASGVQFSKERLENLSKRQKEYVKNNPSPLSIEVFQYDNFGHLINKSSNIHEMSRLCNINHFRIRKYLNDYSKSIKCSGYIFSKVPLTIDTITHIQTNYTSKTKTKSEFTFVKRLNRKRNWVSTIKNMPYYRQYSRFSNMLTYNIHKTTNHKKYIDIIGCSFDELKSELESKFSENMSWDNYGKEGWVVSIGIYDPMETDETKIKSFFHHTNLIPKWAKS